MLKETIKIKPIDLSHQKILKDFGFVISFGKIINCRISAKVQDLTDDGINDGEAYMIDQDYYFFPETISMVSKRLSASEQKWKVTIEFSGTNELITAWFEREVDAISLLNVVLNYRIQYWEDKKNERANRFKQSQ